MTKILVRKRTDVIFERNKLIFCCCCASHSPLLRFSAIRRSRSPCVPPYPSLSHAHARTCASPILSLLARDFISMWCCWLLARPMQWVVVFVIGLIIRIICVHRNLARLLVRSLQLTLSCSSSTIVASSLLHCICFVLIHPSIHPHRLSISLFISRSLPLFTMVPWRFDWQIGTKYNSVLWTLYCNRIKINFSTTYFSVLLFVLTHGCLTCAECLNDHAQRQLVVIGVATHARPIRTDRHSHTASIRIISYTRWFTCDSRPPRWTG